MCLILVSLRYFSVLGTPPDGYVGAISTLDDTNAIADYFARIAS